MKPSALIPYSVLIILAGIVALSTACSKTQQNRGSGGSLPADSLSGSYSGMFPCADCGGLRMDLTLHPDSTYRLKRTYLASPAGDTSFVVTGQWSIIRNNPHNPKSILCALNPQDSTRRTLYRFIPPDTLLSLDRKGREIHSPFNESLVRNPH